MKVVLLKKFVKQFDKASRKIQRATSKRLDIFEKDEFDPVLKNHELRGKYKGLRSINVTGDWRALFRKQKNGDIRFFVLLGTHSELYG